jgi:hypothetical protein
VLAEASNTNPREPEPALSHIRYCAFGHDHRTRCWARASRAGYVRRFGGSRPSSLIPSSPKGEPMRSNEITHAAAVASGRSGRPQP